MRWYGILEFNVPLDTVQVISETTVHYAKKWGFGVSDRHMFQQVAIDVSRMCVTEHIGKLFSHQYFASVPDVGFETQQVCQVRAKQYAETGVQVYRYFSFLVDELCQERFVIGKGI